MSSTGSRGVQIFPRGKKYTDNFDKIFYGTSNDNANIEEKKLLTRTTFQEENEKDQE